MKTIRPHTAQFPAGKKPIKAIKAPVKATKKTATAVLDGDADHAVTVRWGSGRDADTFSVKDVIEALRHAEVMRLGKERIREGIDIILKKSFSWCKDNRSRIHDAWMTEREGGLLLVVVGAEDYDGTLHDSLIALEFTLAEDKQTERLDFCTLLLPRESSSKLQAFLSPKFKHQNNLFLPS